jgi:hypothetical protein
MSTDQKIAAAKEAILDFPWLPEAVVAALEPQQASQA